MGRLETVKSKYPSIDWDVVKSADPSKNFKYLDWIGLNFVKSNTAEIKEVLAKFEKYKDKLSEKDIAKYDVTDLKKKLEELGPSGKEAKIAGSVSLPDVDNVKIVMLEGKEAVKQYTAGTRWCISNYSTFVNYAKDNNIFVLTSNKTKMCVVYDGRYGNQYSVWVPNDSQLDMRNGAFKYLLTFLGAEGKALTNAIDKCAAYTRENKNLWYQIEHSPLTDELLKKVAENKQEEHVIDILWDSYYYRSGTKMKTFLQFIAQNKEKYPTFVAKIESAHSKTCYDYDHYDYDSYYGGYKRITLPQVWAKLLKFMEPKVEKKKPAKKKAAPKKKAVKASKKTAKTTKKKVAKKKAAKRTVKRGRR